jgi:1-acyl-sn-glycerol-3-phosphate acyltransferase
MINSWGHTLLTYFTAIFCYLLFWPFIVIGVVFSKDKEKPFLVASWLWYHCLLRAAGVHLTIQGKAHLQGLPEQVLYISNHASYFDIPILGVTLPCGVRFIARDNLFRAPFLGWIMRNAGHVQVDREGGHQVLKTIKSAAKKVKAGTGIIIFPEGERSRDGKIHEFKKGSLLIASLSKAVLVPIALSGTYHIMPRHSWLVRPTQIIVTIGAPVSAYHQTEKPKQSEEEILGELQKTIEAGLQ